MFAETAEKLPIKVIAQRWSSETGVRHSAEEIEAVLIDYFNRLYNPDWNKLPNSHLFDPTLPISSDKLVTRSELLEFCQDNEIETPTFWFGRKAVTTGTERRCREWLEKKVKQTGQHKTKTKDEWFEVARSEVGTELPRRMFDRVWDEIAPAEWKKAGRPTKITA